MPGNPLVKPGRRVGTLKGPGSSPSAGSSPDAFATLPKEWTADQIRSFQDYFDALMSGNLARRRQTKFMPADFKLIEARQPPLKDQYDEWLARIICYAFSCQSRHLCARSTARPARPCASRRCRKASCR